MRPALPAKVMMVSMTCLLVLAAGRSLGEHLGGAKVAGVRTSDGSFGFFGELVKYWTATRGGAHAYDALYWGLNWFDRELGRSSHQRTDGHSVRCVKD